MKQFIVESMTDAVLSALDLPEDKRAVVAHALRSYWDGKIAIVWTRTDIARICDMNLWKRPALEDCDLFLDSLLLETHGVTTEIIEARLQDAGLAVPE